MLEYIIDMKQTSKYKAVAFELTLKVKIPANFDGKH